MATILVVEDEIELCADIADELKETGYDVLQAYNGHDGLFSILGSKPDLVICDVTMPCMSGHELLAAVRNKQPEIASIPFIFLSALSDRRDVLNGIDLGADDYLTKPVDFDFLLAKVKAQLRQSERFAARFGTELAQFTRKLDAIDSVDGVLDAVIDYLSKYGCEYIIIGALPLPGQDAESVPLALRWPKGLWQYYVDNNLFVVNPVVQHALRVGTPFHWSEAPLVKGKEELCRRVLEIRARHGMKEGFVVPLNGEEGMQFIASFGGRQVSVPTNDYMTVSAAVHRSFDRLCALSGKVLKRPGELSTREREIVQWAAHGKTSDEIAAILDITPRTVVMHLQNASNKLQAVNRVNLIAQAIRYNQIDY